MIMIDLAPNHKLGLSVSNPILIAGGVIGYGEAAHSGLETARLGGVVIGPISLNSRGGPPGPRLAELNGGFVVDTGLQNRGLSAVLKQFASLWPRLGCPVIAQVIDTQPGALARVAARLTSAEQLSGLELLLPRQADAELTRSLVRVVTQESDLPVWVKVPLERAVELAPVAVTAGAVGVVVGQPLVATALRGEAGTQTATDPVSPITGSLYGPLMFAPMLTSLLAVTKLALPCALIACGGIHTARQVQQALAAGAHAVQIDSAVWVEPGLPVRLMEEGTNG
jgi:dihydroorotate dehydrogenase (NAD+) catalytic subunit